MEVYPDAKVILTVRDPERWHKSIMHTIYQHSRKFRRFARIIPAVYQFLEGMEKVIWKSTFDNKLENKAHAIEVFKAHIEEVERVVPPERLLVFEARQGWEPLCAFLGVPVPENMPFPHKNKGKVVRQILKHTSVLKWGALVALLAFLISVVQALVV